MRLAVAEQKFAISGDPARHIIGPLGEGADPAHAREDVHILFGGLELVERAGRGAVEIEPEEVGGSEHADRIIGIDRNTDACELISILAGENRLSVRGDQPGTEGRETIFVDPRKIAEDDHVRLRAVARRTPGAEIDDIGAAVVGLTRQIFFGAAEEAAVAARQILLAEDIDRREDMAGIGRASWWERGGQEV